MLLRSIDGTVLVRFYGEERFGLYSVAMQMATYMYALPQAVNFVLWPKVIQSYGAGENEQRRRRRVLAPTLGLAALLPVGGGLAWVLMPAAVDLLVPKFAPSVPATQVLGLGSTFLALPLATNAALVGGDQEITVIATKLIGAAVIGGGTWRLVRRQGLAGGGGDGHLRPLCAGGAAFTLRADGRLLSLAAAPGGRGAVHTRPTAWVAGALADSPGGRGSGPGYRAARGGAARRRRLPGVEHPVPDLGRPANRRAHERARCCMVVCAIET